MSVQIANSEIDRARYRFRVAEYADGTPWIMTDPLHEDLKLLTAVKGFLGFDLPSGTSHEAAQTIAKFMNDHLESITCTSFPGGFNRV